MFAPSRSVSILAAALHLVALTSPASAIPLPQVVNGLVCGLTGPSLLGIPLERCGAAAPAPQAAAASCPTATATVTVTVTGPVGGTSVPTPPTQSGGHGTGSGTSGGVSVTATATVTVTTSTGGHSGGGSNPPATLFPTTTSLASSPGTATPGTTTAAAGGTNSAATTTVTVTSAPASTPIPASQCNVGNMQCCNSVQPSNSQAVTPLLGLLGIVLNGVAVPVGVTCSPINILGLGGGSQCNAQPVCCENNSFSGVIAIGCTPININL